MEKLFEILCLILSGIILVFQAALIWLIALNLKIEFKKYWKK